MVSMIKDSSLPRLETVNQPISEAPIPVQEQEQEVQEELSQQDINNILFQRITNLEAALFRIRGAI